MKKLQNSIKKEGGGVKRKKFKLGYAFVSCS
ncbi:MAG: hypothetical protein SCABRO_03009 [Candidatus Scalindua brodae]|uniref:Uncharacterized protein n=1 Tax=Candidatus Scalindua brodae TaxID=237368 RepID=A0A0B0EFG7_9BACT|nr:MAG: hypothetical protein SCABRO_03009 [Candidatus Scalindua brodae]